MVENLFKSLPPLSSHDEQSLPLLTHKNVRLVRIVSTGQSSAPRFWYDQNESEWVTLLQGEAVIEFTNGAITLVAGDCYFIPAHTKHRVAMTAQKEHTIWLALFIA